MMELFAETPKTTKQVAALLGEPPTRLYHHVTALERAGLLVLKETRQNRGAVEKWYVGVAQRLQSSDKGARSRASRRAVAATVLEQAKQEIASIPAGAKESALLARIVVAMPKRRVAAVRKRLYETIRAMREDLGPEEGEKSSTDCERWAITLAFAPVVTPRKK